VPTGVALRDVRRQLFDAAERVLLRDGPSGLTSRAVTDEAQVAKGVLHRHFADFDAFLAEFVLDRVNRLDAGALRDAAGTGTVVDNVADALRTVFESVAVAIVPLVTFRDELRARLRDTWPAGVPVLTDAIELIADYLTAERSLGRVASAAEPQFLGPMLVGSAHLLYADRTGARPTPEAVRTMVASALSGFARRPVPPASSADGAS
jgi:AcrR family transcriptional regulator